MLTVDSVFFDWKYKKDVLVKVHHIGLFYRITDYTDEVKKEILLKGNNDDSLGAEFYEINKLEKNSLSKIALLVLDIILDN